MRFRRSTRKTHFSLLFFPGKPTAAVGCSLMSDSVPNRPFRPHEIDPNELNKRAKESESSSVGLETCATFEQYVF